jgi:H+-translocating NAD(P) transhydrogenase subunit alpha
VKKLAELGAEVRVESGAGLKCGLRDEDYSQAGAVIVADAAAGVSGADIVLRVRRPAAAEITGAKPGAAILAIMDPYCNAEALKSVAAARVCAFAMEFMPRITRAQSMDVLSSQANVAGYRAVIDAAAEYGRVIPMMMTAAGMIQPAKIFIMGVGVAGLQAIAMARKLTNNVTATDVRPATKEQVVSLGAKFVAVEDEEFKQAETAAGYAKEMSAAYKAKQAALIAEHISSQDIVITTALIPGRPAPVLISAAMVESMRPGSVVVDLAAERGGNCELTKAGETVVSKKGVKIVGRLNLAGQVPATASALYAKNLSNFVETMIDPKAKVLAIKWDDELVKATLLTKDGALVHPSVGAGS